MIRELLRKMFRRDDSAPGPAETEELRASFRSRYHHFKLLLSANNQALETMAGMEEALRGVRPFGIGFVRSSCARVSADVFRIIRSMEHLSGGKYQALEERFRQIRARIDPHIAPSGPLRQGKLVLDMEEVDASRADLVGGKMATLGEAGAKLGLRVPDGFVVTAAAYERFMRSSDLNSEIDRRIQAADLSSMDRLLALSKDLQRLILRSPLPGEIEEALGDALARLETRLGHKVHLAMRSSALGEDAAGSGFAGQYRSILNVDGEDLLQVYREVVASKYSLQAMAYRFNKGIPDAGVAMCVGCLEMINARAGGVAYTRDPTDFRADEVLVNAVFGLPKAVVDGSVSADLFRVSRKTSEIVSRELKRKRHKYVCYPEEGVCREELAGEDAETASLTDAEVLELVGTVLRMEEYFGAPQDVEWALDEQGRLVILQSRPLGPPSPRKDGKQDGEQGEEAAEHHISREGLKTLVAGGETASPGVAAGPVFAVRKDMDAMRFPQGGVLLVSQPLPRWAALLSRASAVVAESGSIMGHLANVAREFRVPALFGVEDALDRLAEGTLVTVDADGRRVLEGRADSLLDQAREERPFMLGTPVHDTLEKVARHIVPLHLLDPESPVFRASNCRTMHDITRFCHEKAVEEMFTFGTSHRFPERAAKQLVCDVPMQFWIINLDDGFRQDVPGRHIRLEDIVSIPMLALWRGMMAVAWQGPPPVDTRGFLSVLIEASANPALDPAASSPYAVRNYFMISRNFCSLQSRFGFHFCTVEALVGERTSENYASFQFKGGAADMQRRVQRARFVAELLEERGFRSEVREDAAFCRMEDRPQEVMEEGLLVLGYCITHTRQLDMIMRDAASLRAVRERFEREIDGMLASEPPSSCPSGSGSAEA